MGGTSQPSYISPTPILDVRCQTYFQKGLLTLKLEILPVVEAQGVNIPKIVRHGTQEQASGR